MLELENLNKVIQNYTVIDIDVLKVAPGEVAALVGPAGSGKKVLFDLLTGNKRPTSGHVRIAGLDPFAQRQEINHRIGVLFEDDSLYQRLSALANLTFHCRLFALPSSRAEEVLQLVGLGDHADVNVDKLPSGLARRLAFGRALLHQPDVFLLVEPFNRCDDSSISLLGSLISEQARRGAATLIIANDTAYLGTLCDIVYTLEGGRIIDRSHPQAERQSELPFKVPVRLEGRVALVNPVDILFADVEDGRAYLHTSNERLPTQFTLSELEDRLRRSGFFRAHRAYLVNLQHVKEVIPYTRNSFSLRLNDPANTEIPLSKSAAAELKTLLGY